MTADPPFEQDRAETQHAPSTPTEPSLPVSKVQLALELPPGVRLRITIEALSGDEGQVPAAQAEAGRVVKTLVLGPGPGSQELLITLPAAVPSAAEAAVSRSPSLAGKPPAALLQAVPLQPAPSRRVSTAAHGLGAWLATLRAWPLSLEMTLFGLALAVYLATRLIGLTSFPIYFFTDEAVQTVLAADLVRDGFHSYDKDLLPTYFKNGTQYNLSTSVYLQVLPYLLFGKSVFVTRATAALVTLLAALSVGLILRDIFRLRYAWAGTLLLSAAPAWFLHSRTAFETALMVSFYAAMLYCYLLYRYRSPGYLYPCLVLAALAFYSYSPGQVVVVVTALLLLISDARYHWQQRQTVLRGLLLAVLLALPYLRFRLIHPTAALEHLRNLGSYWMQPLPFSEKLARFASEYLYGLSPGYWFVPNERDLARHQMVGYGHLLRLTLPLALAGLVIALKEFRRSSAHRAVLCAGLAAPAGAALAQVGITRVLVFVIPAVLLTSLGLIWLLTWLQGFRLVRQASGEPPGEAAGRLRKLEWSPAASTSRAANPLLSLAVFGALALASFAMLRDALVNGPTWYSDYGLGGLQYGASQVFGAVKEYLRQQPGTSIIVSPSWSNGTDVVARFFFPDPLPFEMGSIEGHLNRRLPLGAETLFVMIPDEYQLARNSGKFTGLKVERTLPYPDGRPGFYFVRLRYVDNIDAILEAERQARRELVSGQMHWLGQTVQVRYPRLDIGEIENAFDGDLETVIRGLEANPLVIDLEFETPVTLEGVYLKFGSVQIRATAQLYPTGGGEPVDRYQEFTGSIDRPDGTIRLGRPVEITRLRLVIEDPYQPEPGHIHIWEIELR